MSLAEVQGTARANLTQYGAALPVRTAPVSPAYVSAVKSVATAPKGTVISTAPKTVITAPKVVTNILTNPVMGAVGVVQDFWGLVLGSREEKVSTIGEYLPISVQATDMGKTITKTFDTVLQTKIDTSKMFSPEAKKFWETPTLANTNIELPKIELPNLDIFGKIGEYGKWILIGGAVLLGVYFISKMGSGKKE